MNWGNKMEKRTLIKGKPIPKIFECKLCGCVFSSNMDGCYWIDDVLSSDCPNCEQRCTLANLNTYENKDELVRAASMSYNDFYKIYDADRELYGECSFPPPKKKWTNKKLKRDRDN